jgi:hypothetical protein
LRFEQRGDLVCRNGLTPLGLGETLLNGGPLVVAWVIELTLARFQREQHLSGVFLPLSRPSQNAIENLFNLIFRHAQPYISFDPWRTLSGLAVDPRAGSAAAPELALVTRNRSGILRNVGLEKRDLHAVSPLPVPDKCLDKSSLCAELELCANECR